VDETRPEPEPESAAEVIAESDATIAEDRGSEDPVARRRLAQALARKAVALGRLERYRDALELWDELFVLVEDRPLAQARIERARSQSLVQLGDDHGALSALERAVRLCDGEDSPKARLLVGQTLSSRGAILHRLGDADQARRIAEEIVERFLDDPEPELRWRAAYSLGWLASERLRSGDVAGALRYTERLLLCFDAEQDDDVVDAIGEFLVGCCRELLQFGGPAAITIVRALALVTGTATAQTTSWLMTRLGADPGRIAHTLRLPPPFLADLQARAAQAERIARAIEARFADSDRGEREEALATVSILGAASQVVNGDPRGGFRAFTRLTGSRSEAVAAAFDREARRSLKEGGVRGEFGAASFLAHRADTLGQGDNYIARMAYEESLRSGTPTALRTRRGRLYARILKPGK
jgi:tetratricopeptide (TPR) repeat protein